MRARAPTRKARPHLLPATDGLPLEVREVVEALVASLGDDLSAIYWQGSEAHAEAKPDSDHDLIIVMAIMSLFLRPLHGNIFKCR